MGILTGTLRIKSLCRICTLQTIIAVLGITPCSATAEGSLEYTVEAAFLYKFGYFVEWPATAFVSPTSPFNLCVVGDDPFGATLDKVVEGELVNGHNIVIHRLKTVEKHSNCHVLYIGGSDAQQAAQIIESVRGSNVLTVSNFGGSKTDTGIIDFVIANNRVRFNIDDEAAAQNELVISSQLMNLALNIKRRASKKEQ